MHKLASCKTIYTFEKFQNPKNSKKTNSKTQMHPISLLLLLCLILIPSAFTKLEMAIEVFRHGARQPTDAPFDPDLWPEYNGELTAAGMRQHYLLGKEMRRKYIKEHGLLSETFNHSELYVRSTDVNRTLMSVQSHLLGLYPLGEGGSFPENYPLERAVPPYLAKYDIKDLGFNALPDLFQPIPVHVVEKGKDLLLAPYDACPNYKAMKKAQKATDLYKSFQVEFKSILDEATKVFNMSKPLDMSKLGTIVSDVQCDIFQNNKLPEALTQELLNNITMLKGLEVQYVDVGTDEEKKLLATPFLQTVQSYFQAKIKGETAVKYAIFSAHDTTLQPFMAALNLTSWNCILDQLEGKWNDNGNCVAGYPVFATQIMFELHSDVSDFGVVYSVKIIYNGVEMKVCEKEKTECLFEEFSQRLDNYLLNADDFEESCGSEKTAFYFGSNNNFLKKK